MKATKLKGKMIICVSLYKKYKNYNIHSTVYCYVSFIIYTTILQLLFNQTVQER